MFKQEIISDGIKSYIKVSFEDREIIDFSVLEKMSQCENQHILKNKLVSESNLPTLWFSIENRVNLNQWVEKKGKLSKKEFVAIMTDVINILLDQGNGWSPYYYILSSDNIFIDPHTFKVSLIYIPVFALKGYFVNRFKGMIKDIVPKHVNYSKAEKLYTQLYNDLDSSDFNVMRLKTTLDLQQSKMNHIENVFDFLVSKVQNSFDLLIKQSRRLVLRGEKKRLTQSLPKRISADELTKTSYFLEPPSPYLLRLSNFKKHVVGLGNHKWAIIGRSENANICIPDGTLSKEHVKICFANRQYMIEDLNSLNGTRLNGVRLEQKKMVALSDGDEIEIADIKFIWKHH